jgi:hypothetical protein
MRATRFAGPVRDHAPLPNVSQPGPYNTVGQHCSALPTVKQRQRRIPASAGPGTPANSRRNSDSITPVATGVRRVAELRERGR